MPFDAFGNFTRSFNFTADKLAAVKIQSVRVDGEFDNYATAMNQVVLRSGVAPMTGALKMGNNNITGLAAGAAATPSFSFNGDVTTGMFSPAVGIIGFAITGVEVARFTATGFQVTPLATFVAGANFNGPTAFNSTITFSGIPTFNVQPVYAANIGPGEVLLSSGVAAAVAALDIPLPTGYSAYVLRVSSIDPVTDVQALALRVSVDAGATFKSGAADYTYAGTYVDDTSGAAVWRNAAATSIKIQPVNATNATGYDPTLEIEINKGPLGNCTFLWRGWMNTATTLFKAFFTGGGSTIWGGANVIRLIYNSGNVANATWALYGRRGL